MTASVNFTDRVEPTSWFNDVRVLECTIGVSTPLTGRVLSDLGADVVRLESRAKLDVNRARLTRRTDWNDVPAEESFGLLHEANAGKRSATIDLKTEGGRELFGMLVDRADVLIQNFVPGWLERLGLSVAALRERNPRLIVLSASCSGQDGPGSRQRAYAPVMTALAGVEGLIGYEDGVVLGTMSSALADLNAAYVGAYAVLSALLQQRRTGQGVHLDLSQTESAGQLVGEALVEWQLTGVVPGPQGNGGMTPAPWHLIPCEASATGWIGVASTAAADGTVLIGEDALAAIGSLATGSGPAAVEAYCCDHGYEYSAVAPSPPGLFSGSAGASDRRLAQLVKHPYLGGLTVTALPWRFDGVQPTPSGASPLLGENTADVLADSLGLDAAAIERYDAQGALR
jgi:crotonobetainyl-CoA:carnitine CoA-transferase CaiB-like acyl-CoA transferase